MLLKLISYFPFDLKETPKSPKTNNTDKQDEVPHDESASEKSLSEKSVDEKLASEQSTSATDTPRHKIVLDRNVCIKLGEFMHANDFQRFSPLINLF